MSDQPTPVPNASEEIAAAAAGAALPTQPNPMTVASDPQETATQPLDATVWAAQRTGRFFALGYLIFVLVASLLLILYFWTVEDRHTFFLFPFLDSSNIIQVRPYLYAFLSAVCGGTVYCFQAYNWYFSRHLLDLAKNWTWYFTHPLLSGTYGAIFFALLNGHLLGIQVASNAASTIIGFSFLVGFGTKQVDSKIKETLNTLFGTPGR